MPGDWIQGAVKRPGAFTAKAKAAGMGVQEYAREKQDAPGRLGKQARLAMTFAKMRRAANGAEIIDSSEPNMVLVGDGGKDPAAEEYVFLPPGSDVIIAPKMKPDEKPSMSNALKAVANLKLKKAQQGMVSGGGMSTGRGVPTAGYGSNVRNTPAEGFMQTGYRGGQPVYTRMQAKVGGNPASNQPREVIPGNQNGMGGDIPASPIPGGPAVPAAPFDPGIRREGALSLLSVIENMQENPMVSDQDNFAARPGSALLAAADGLIRAQQGAVTTVKDGGGMVLSQTRSKAPSASYSTSGSGYSSTSDPYRNELSANTKYQTDAQRAIAQMQIDANARIAEMTNRYNMERLALDRLMGDRQLQLDRDRAAKDAAQLMMTRAGRQMNAPGGNVIPSLQPLIGRSIN